MRGQAAMGDELTLSLQLVQHLALTALPMAAAALAAARSGVRSVPVLLAVGLAAGGAAAIGVFWAFYADPLLGEAAAYLVLFGSVLLVCWSLYGRTLDPGLLRALATPLALWALGAAFVLFLGFAHGGTADPLATSSIRFSHPLPADNYIPSFYADWFFENGHAGAPPVFPGEWLSSDRPPLQVGYVLAQRPFDWDETGLHYQVLGVVLQQLWIVGLWALLLAARVGRVTRALATLTVLVSAVAIVNGFYVWPKLLPVAMLLGAASLMVTPLWSRIRGSLWGATLVGALLGLALLGHGASVFGAMPLVAIAASRGLPSWRWLGVGLLVGVALMGPWIAYQNYGDPPGNRLSKWFAAGVVEIDDRGVGESIVDSYSEAEFGGVLENKAENFAAMTSNDLMRGDVEAAVDAIGAGDLEETARRLRAIFFFYLLPSLGLLLFAPVAMAAAWRRRRRAGLEWSFALTCFALLLIGGVAWGLLMFGGTAATTVIHQGTYLLPVIGVCGAAVGLRAAFPRFAVGFLTVNAVAMLALYAPALDPPEGSAYSAFAVLAAIAAFFAFAAAALRGAAPSSSSPTP